jgi:hypothetical protein
MLMVVLALAGVTAVPAMQSDPRFGQRGQRGSDNREWTERDKQERLDFLAKRLAWRIKEADPAAEQLFLSARAAELLERMKRERVNNFQFDRLGRATDALFRAGERIFGASQAARVDQNDKRDAALFLQRCYFRVQQAEYFSGLCGEKESKQYVTYSRSLYQQARSAYDARQYDRAQMLGEASSLLVAALENIAQASLRIPDPPVIK